MANLSAPAGAPNLPEWTEAEDSPTGAEVISVPSAKDVLILSNDAEASQVQVNGVTSGVYDIVDRGNNRTLGDTSWNLSSRLKSITRIHIHHNQDADEIGATFGIARASRISAVAGLSSISGPITEVDVGKNAAGTYRVYHR